VKKKNGGHRFPTAFRRLSIPGGPIGDPRLDRFDAVFVGGVSGELRVRRPRSAARTDTLEQRQRQGPQTQGSRIEVVDPALGGNPLPSGRGPLLAPSSLHQNLERDDLEGGFVGGGQHHLRSLSGLPCLLPARGAEAPAITGFEPRESELRPGRREVVPTRPAELQELRGHDGANGVDPQIFGTGFAAPVPEEPGERVVAARFQIGAEDIGGHGSAEDEERRDQDRRPVPLTLGGVPDFKREAYARQASAGVAFLLTLPDGLAYPLPGVPDGEARTGDIRT